MTRKPLCISYANCQGRAVLQLLAQSPAFSRAFDCVALINWERPQLRQELFDRCGLLLHQYLPPEWGEHSTQAVLQRLPQDCPTISFAYQYCTFLWPMHEKSANTLVAPQFPGERHFYRDTVLERLTQTDLPPAVAARAYANMDLAEAVDLHQIYNSCMQRQRSKEKHTDIRGTDFVERLFAKRRLFTTVRHPDAPLYAHLANQILRLLDLPPLRSRDVAAAGPFYGTPYEHPVHPSVKRFFGLFWADESSRYTIWDSSFTFEEYAADYVAFRRLETAMARRLAGRQVLA